MIIEQPEWLPGGQKNIGVALNDAATNWASGQLMSVTIFAETTDGHFKMWGTEPENLLAVIGMFSSFASYLSHNIPFDGEEEVEEDEDD